MLNLERDAVHKKDADEEGKNRVLRGGAYYTDRLARRTSARSADAPDNRQNGTVYETTFTY